MSEDTRPYLQFESSTQAAQAYTALCQGDLSTGNWNSRLGRIYLHPDGRDDRIFGFLARQGFQFTYVQPKPEPEPPTLLKDLYERIEGKGQGPVDVNKCRLRFMDAANVVFSNADSQEVEAYEVCKLIVAAMYLLLDSGIDDADGLDEMLLDAARSSG